MGGRTGLATDVAAFLVFPRRTGPVAVHSGAAGGGCHDLPASALARLVRDQAAHAASAVPADGSLVRWAQQGVLLLNTCLTVEDGQPASHAKQGWEVLTDELIKAVIRSKGPVVFLLWGAHAQRMGDVVRAQGALAVDECSPGRHLVLCANHPSPLSALRPPQPFLGCGHFSRANAFLQRNGQPPIIW